MSFTKKILSAVCLVSLLAISTIHAKSYKPSFDVQQFIAENKSIKVTDYKSYYSVLPAESKEYDTGFIFYQGAYVDVWAYLPLVCQLAENGVPCFVMKMPSDLAILKPSAANDIIKNDSYKTIKHWYLGGHSLGGLECCNYVSKNKQVIDGIVLLASYSIDDLSKSKTKVLSVYGDCDGVLRIKQYKKALELLPKDYQELIIEGGNHSGFANYGLQKGDGIPKISQETQIKTTVQRILDFLEK